MITIISGTNRPDSSTLKIAREVEDIYRKLEVETQLLDLQELPNEIFEPSSYATKPLSFNKFTQPILEAKGLVVIAPEYNGGPPGVLKYFIDMLPFPESFEHRPVAFIGLAAGMWGGLRPVEHLQQIFGYRNAHIFPDRIFLPGIMSLLSDESKLKSGLEWELVEKQCKDFVNFTKALND